MEYARVFTLLAITLLLNCRAEISDTPESWYSANVINDGSFSPKPLTEIFSIKPPFPSTNPLILLSATTENQNFGTTSALTPTNISTIPITSTTKVTTLVTPADREAVVPLQTTSSASISQPQTSQTKPQLIQTESQTLRSSLPSQSPQSQPITFQSQFPSLQPLQPTIIQSQPNPLQSQPGFVQQFVIPAQSFSNQSQTQSIPVTRQFSPAPQPTGLPNSNYFVIYQHATQSIQTGSQQMVSTPTPRPISTPPATTITRPTQMPYIRTTTAQITEREAQRSTFLPSLIPQPSAQYPVLRIRMIAPSGSITNVNVNPPNNPTTTTRTTTTRATTTRARKTRRKNNYDDCVNSCGETRLPICASPVGVIPINPDTLRGFPSICHMACHNSFRRNAYEKVIDGKCGRLRTRIRTVDSDSKLKREELNKVQYTIVQPEPQTVVEFSPLTS